MRRNMSFAALLVSLALVAAACGGGRTDTGFPSETPTPDEACPAKTPAPAEQPQDETFISATGLEFDRDELLLSADTEVKIEFQNCDVNIPHNVSVYAGENASADPIVKEAPFGGVNTVTYTVPATPKGEYYFQCDVHPNMNGTATFA